MPYVWNNKGELVWEDPPEPVRKPRGSAPDPTSERQRQPWAAVPCSKDAWYKWKAEGVITALEKAGLPVTPDNVALYRKAREVSHLFHGPQRDAFSKLLEVMNFVDGVCNTQLMSKDSPRAQAEASTPPGDGLWSPPLLR